MRRGPGGRLAFLPVQEPADKISLRQLLEVVAGHAYKSDAKRHGRIPLLVDDPIKDPIGDRAKEVKGHLVNRVEVAAQ